MRSDGFRVHGRDNERRVSDLRGMAAIAAQYPDDFCSYRFGEADSGDYIRADVLFGATSAHGQNENGVVLIESAHLEPFDECAFPTVVVDAGGEFRNIVRGGVALHSGEFSKIIHSMRTITGASAHTQKEYSARGCLYLRQQFSDLLYGGNIQSLQNRGRLPQMLLR